MDTIRLAGGTSRRLLAAAAAAKHTSAPASLPAARLGRCDGAGAGPRRCGSSAARRRDVSAVPVPLRPPWARRGPRFDSSWPSGPSGFEGGRRAYSSSTRSDRRRFAFAFDIDGVLLHINKPIPGATEALRLLHDNGIPFILLTNGGGKPEADRVRELSALLDVPLTTANFVQSHTPFQELLLDDGGGGGGFPSHPSLRNATVLVTGADAAACRAIAESYGFRNVVIPADLLAAQPTMWPFDPLLETVYAATARPLPKPLWAPAMGQPEDPAVEAAALRLDAILVFSDPRDWALDTQLIVDALLSHRGLLGTQSRLNGRCGKWQSDGQPALWFSNADLFWSTGYPQPRLGQGAFQAALAGVWRAVTRGRAELFRHAVGKPSARTYAYAERLLVARHAALLPSPSSPLRRVYMVGDNPDSDIAGANRYNSPNGVAWKSVLVKTGVWNPAQGRPKHRPCVTVYDAIAAVKWALDKELWS